MDARAIAAEVDPDRASVNVLVPANTSTSWAPSSALDPLRPETLCFGGFQMSPSARILRRHGDPVEIGGRAFDLLHLLLRSRGAVIERAEIFRHVWPTTTVDEGNLRFQVSCLRRALGEDRHLLKTVPGRGYMMATEIDVPGAIWIAGQEELDAATPPATPSQDLAQTCQILTTLLRSVLDELWVMRRDGSPVDPQSVLLPGVPR